MEHREIKTPERIAELKKRSPGGYRNLREEIIHALPTPKARDSQAEGYEAGLRRATPQVGTIVKGLVEGDQRVCLPTPTTRNHKDGTEPHERDGVVQTDTVARAVFNSGEILLPTTRTSMANGPTQKEIAEGNPKTRIETEVMLGDVNWGKFEPAIRRWEETIGRPSPAPTKPDGKEGAHRLSSAFTEWMMGLPDGWITDVGLSRNDELKACGNGVVPQQAELALRVLLEGVALPRGGGQVNLPTPTVSDTYTDNLASSQQKPGSMHSVTLPQAVRWVAGD
jgi:DNA (cytosine-5)-methyltransferase 1